MTMPTRHCQRRERRLIPASLGLEQSLRKPSWQKIMETTMVYWGYIGIMEKKMETNIVLILGFSCTLNA